MDTIIDLFVRILKMLSGILAKTDDEALGWIFGKGAELLDENRDKITEGVENAE